MISVHEQIVDNEIISYGRASPAFRRQLHGVVDRFLFHLNAGCPCSTKPKNWHKSLQTLVCKDAHKNGRQIFFRTGSTSNLLDGESKIRQIICYVPSTLALNDNSLHVKDGFVWFWYCSNDIDQGVATDEFIMTCLENTRDSEQKELREAVQKTLENDNLTVIQDVVDYYGRKWV